MHVFHWRCNPIFQHKCLIWGLWSSFRVCKMNCKKLSPSYIYINSRQFHGWMPHARMQFNSFFPWSWAINQITLVNQYSSSTLSTMQVHMSFIYGLTLMINHWSLIFGHYDHDHCFLKSLIDWETSGVPTSFYTMSPKMKATMSEHDKIWMRKWHQSLHVQKMIIFGGHLDFVANRSN